MGKIKVVNCHQHNPTQNDFYIGRRSPLGNIFSHLPNTEAKVKVANRDEAVDKYEPYLREQIKLGNRKICDALNTVYRRAKEGDTNLVCFCAPKRCHGDVIKAIINEKLI
jgi:hypothetical protein